MHVIVLDEIDHLVSKVGDSIIYSLTNLNLGSSQQDVASSALAMTCISRKC